MNDNNKEEETLKRKKVRRILLLKTDDELKMISKKKPNIMINSTTITEMNKCYNLYNMQLSEKSKIYFNFVKTEEKIVGINIKQINSSRISNKNEKIEKSNNNKLFNYSFEEDSNSPGINFFPKKINLGEKKFNVNQINSPTNRKKIKKSIKNNSAGVEKTMSKEEKANNSTKVENRGLFKLVDKIINIKMNKDIEGEIKKSIVKLRQYCSTLKNPKRKIKKLNKQKTQTKILEKFEKRTNFNKRMTITSGASRKVFFSKKTLHENEDKKNEKPAGKRIKNRLQTTKFLDVKMKELDIVKEKQKIKRLSSSKLLKKMKSINKEKALGDMKNNLRKVQTVSDDVKNENLESNKIRHKNSDKYKNDNSIHSYKHQSKNHLLSSKFQRPKIQFNNNTININYFYKNVINKEQIKSKFNQKIEKNPKNQSVKKKKEIIPYHFTKKENNNRHERHRYSTKKTKKNLAKIVGKYFHYSKKEDSHGFIHFERKDELEDELDRLNILSEFNKQKFNHL